MNFGRQTNIWVSINDIINQGKGGEVITFDDSQRVGGIGPKLLNWHNGYYNTEKIEYMFSQTLSTSLNGEQK